jgi:hypothetical protein
MKAGKVMSKQEKDTMRKFILYMAMTFDGFFVVER